MQENVAVVAQVRADLYAVREESYQAFQQSLIPHLPKERILGVRIPLLRAYAKPLSDEDAKAFLQQLPHTYLEENLLHAFLIERMRSFLPTLEALRAFLPYVDNWCVCDCMSPKVFASHTEELLPEIRNWLTSAHPYTVRYAIGMLMRYFLGESFSADYPELVASVQSEHYYVRMMIAWYFATALAKQYDAVLPYLTEQRLDVWTHNKAIQKAVESYRVPDEHKQFLKTLKRKEHS